MPTLEANQCSMNFYLKAYFYKLYFMRLTQSSTEEFFLKTTIKQKLSL